MRLLTVEWAENWQYAQISPACLAIWPVRAVGRGQAYSGPDAWRAQRTVTLGE